MLPSCHQLDGLWTTARSSHLAAGYRSSDVQGMCAHFLRSASAVLNNESLMLGTKIYGDSHGLNGALQAVAECGRWFPALLNTARPWQISVEKAPYM